jgi:hypothetical protein
LLDSGILNCRLPSVFSIRKLFWCSEQPEGRLVWPYHARFQLSHVQVLLSGHHHLRIWVLLSVIRGLAIAALPWILDLWSSFRTVFVEIGTSRWIFSSAVTYGTVVAWFFETILPNVWWSLSVNVDFRPLFLFADVVFPRFVYSDITWETVTPETPNNMAVFVTDAPAKRARTICPLSKSDKSPIFRFSHGLSLMHWRERYRV